MMRRWVSAVFNCHLSIDNFKFQFLFVVCTVCVAAVGGGCGQRVVPNAEDGEDNDQPAGPAHFRDVTADSGLDFTYHNGEEADLYTILESLGGGVALIDYDNDGLLDIFLPGGGYFDGPDKKEIKGHPCKLYKNLGNFKFRDVTAEVGLDHLADGKPWFYTHGCAVADYDRDGWPDLLVTGYGRLALFHNEDDGKGGRRFVDVTRAAGLSDDLWSTSAAWADLDGDGYPDLYVCHYLDWSFHNHPVCGAQAADAKRDICAPPTFKAQPHRLYRNNRDRTFTDVSQSAGLRQHTTSDGKGLGVLIVDVNDDRRPDIYAVNDTQENLLYLNRGPRGGALRLEEKGVYCGVARDDHGLPDGSMGVDAADYDGSGRASLWVTNYEMETHSLFRNEGKEFFLYRSQFAGIAAIGRRFVGFGTGFLDIDHDGWEDLFIANGHVLRHPVRTTRLQRPVLLHNEGNGKFANITAGEGPYFQQGHLGRGVAIGDLDNDGQPDLVISHLNEPVVVLRGERNRSAGHQHHWLGVELFGKDNADVVGAKLVLELGDRRLTRFAKGGGSYLSSDDRRLLFGLGDGTKAGQLTVYWPSGLEQHWNGLAVDQYWQVIEGAPTARQASRR
jgi:hypothetical protein